MAEYIEKQAAIDELCYVDEYNSRSIATIREMKPADVRPVVRGRWEISCDGWYPYCPVCKEEPPGRTMTPFCPMCGADLRGGDAE